METFEIRSDLLPDRYQPVASIRLIRVYHVYWGRNAWYSTRIHRFEPGSVHTTFESAAQYCEKRRKQGTEFFIEELPAILFDCGPVALIACQLFAPKPFSSFDHERLKLLGSIIPLYHLTIEQVHYLFEADHMWPERKKPEDEAFIVSCIDSNTIGDLGSQRSFVLHRSKSRGPDYYLDWTQTTSRIGIGVTDKLCAEFNRPHQP